MTHNSTAAELSVITQGLGFKLTLMLKKSGWRTPPGAIDYLRYEYQPGAVIYFLNTKKARFRIDYNCNEYGSVVVQVSLKRRTQLLQFTN